MLKIEKVDSNGVFDIVDSHEGWFGMIFNLRCGSAILAPKQGEIREEANGHFLFEGRLDDQALLKLELKPSGTGKAIIVTPTILNDSEEPVRFSSYGFAVESETKGPTLTEGLKTRYAYSHAENIRHEKYPNYSSTYPFTRPLTAEPAHFGDSPSNGVPALVISSIRGRRRLLVGAATQRRHRLAFNLALPTTPGGPLLFETQATWNGIGDEIIPARSSRELESTLFSVFESAHDGIYDIYMAELAKIHEFQGPKSAVADVPVYCTWNFGICTNVNEEICVKRMRVASELQNNGFFQLDHGYQTQLSGEPAPYVDFQTAGKTEKQTLATVELDAYFPDCRNAWDLTRFPAGPKGFAGKCRSFGLRPSIWWSPRIARNGRIVKEHPEWVLNDSNGVPLNVGYSLLDASQEPVRAFLEKCVRTITEEWGFEGMKLDFYSWMFDHPDAVFKEKGQTGVELKRWFFQMIRSYLGDDGYFLHCISCPLGNPFLAINGFDAFRAGIDIGFGDWSDHIKTAEWLLPALLATSRKTWLLNIDSCMGAPNIPSNERHARLAFAYITSGMLEFSGPIELLDEEGRNDYRKMRSRLDTTGIVRVPDEKAFHGVPLPETIVREHDLEERTFKKLGITHSVALINWSGERKAIAFDFDSLEIGKDAVVSDFWSGDELELQNGMLTATLPPRSTLLVDVN